MGNPEEHGMPISVPVTPTITAVGLAAVFNAQSTGVDFEISHIAFGTAQYNPNGTETALQAEKVRVPIAGGGPISPTQIQIYAVAMAASGDPFFVGEVGFFGDNGATLLAVYSSTATPNLFLSDTVATSVSYALGLAALPANSVTVTIDPSASAALLIIGQHVASPDPHPQYVQKVNGVAFYDPTVTFKQGAEIIGDDLLVYQSIQANNIGHPPSTSPTWWVPLYNYGNTPVTGLTNAGVTLSSTQAARSRITLTGALTANLNIIFPTWQKDWTIVNATTGNFTITCKTAAGSGAIIAQGGAASIYGDGTNINLPALAVGTATQPAHALQLQQAQGMRMQYRAQTGPATSQNMTTAIAGESIIWAGGTGTLTLPDVSTMNFIGVDAVTFTNCGTGPVTIACFAGQAIAGPVASPASIVLQIGDDLVITPRSTTTWRTVSGSALRQFAPLVIAPAVAANQAAQLGQIFQSIAVSVASNALTGTLAGPTGLPFRNPSLSNGAPVFAPVPATLSLTVPSPATLGTTSGNAARLVWLVAYNGGSPVLCVVNLNGAPNLDETTLVSPTTISSGATSTGVIYSASAVSANSPFRIVGFSDITEATPGTWATGPTTVQGSGGQALASMSSIGYGQAWQSLLGSRNVGTTYVNTTGKPISVNVAMTSSATQSTSTLTVNGVITYGSSAYVAGAPASTVSSIVPPGASYVAGVTLGTPSLAQWVEMR
jgi:hypothetical protein